MDAYCKVLAAVFAVSDVCASAHLQLAVHSRVLINDELHGSWGSLLELLALVRNGRPYSESEGVLLHRSDLPGNRLRLGRRLLICRRLLGRVSRGCRERPNSCYERNHNETDQGGKSNSRPFLHLYSLLDFFWTGTDWVAE